MDEKVFGEPVPYSIANRVRMSPKDAERLHMLIDRYYQIFSHPR